MPVPQENTSEMGLKELKTVLTQLGVNPNSYILPTVRLVSAQFNYSRSLSGNFEIYGQFTCCISYRQSLPIAGESGTLKNRFNITTNRVNLQAKTGTMSGVSALSGYIEVPNYEPLVLALSSINLTYRLQKCDRRRTKLCYY